MRIQQFTIFTPKTNNLQTSKSQRLHFGNKPCGDEYRVKEVDYKGSKIPYVYIDNDYKSSLGDDELEKSIRTAFRDDEIFDDKKDSVDSLYRHYDDNDVVSPKEFYIKANDDYLLKRNLLINRNKDFEVDIEYPQYLYKKIEVEKDPFDYSEMLPKIFSKNKNKEVYKKIDEMSYLKKFNKSIFSFELNDCLVDKYNRNYPLSEIEKVRNLSLQNEEYTENGKTYIIESVSCKRIDIYFDLKDKKKINSVKDYEKLIKFANRGYWGRENLLFEMIMDLAQKAPLDKVIKTYSDTYRKRFLSDVQTEEDKQEHYEEIFRILEDKQSFS